jgi:hypothetical protein
MSDGLLDRPEDTTYYDYLLADPKDRPYASFRFHYRSWDNLEQLQLIPSRSYGVIPSSLPAGGGISDTSTIVPKSEYQMGDYYPGVDADGHGANIPGSDNRPPASDDLGIEERFIRAQPRQRKPVAILRPSKAIQDGISGTKLLRPLPEIPFPQIPGLVISPNGRSRASSQGSHSSDVSITPSLRPYLDDESFNADSWELGTASEAPVRKASESARMVDVMCSSSSHFLTPTSSDRPLADTSCSEYAPSVWSSEDNYTKHSPPPVNRQTVASFRAGHPLTRHNELSVHPESMLRSPARLLMNDNGPEEERDVGQAVKGLRLTEHEWMRPLRIPSTVPEERTKQESDVSESQHLRGEPMLWKPSIEHWQQSIALIKPENVNKHGNWI